MDMELTVKFVKTLQKFIKWVNKNYQLKCKTTLNRLKWNLDTPLTFTEPPRKKLHGYLKCIFDEYIIQDNDNKIISSYTYVITRYDDFLLENKKKETTELVSNEINQCNYDNMLKLNMNKLYDNLKQNLLPESNKSKDNDNYNDNYNYNLKSNIIHFSEIIKNDEKIVLYNHLDTSKTSWLSKITFSTKDLISILGHPLHTGKENDMHRYEWKFTYNCCIYSIYDWKFDSTFEPIENTKWYLAGDNSDKDNINNIITILTNDISKFAVSVKKN